MGKDAGLFGGVFKLDPVHCPDVANSYQNWLTRQERRSVQG
jgi:hypothetical protein